VEQHLYLYDLAEEALLGVATIQMLNPPEGREKADCRVMAEGVGVNQEVGRGLIEEEECPEGRERLETQENKQCSLNHLVRRETILLNHFLETILLRLILVRSKDRYTVAALLFLILVK
jgi:hypothetical protein